MVLTILVDENIDGYADYLSQLLAAPELSDIASLLEIEIVGFAEAGLTTGTPDDRIWEFCQQRRMYLVTDNRNQDDDTSLEATIRTRNKLEWIPVFTISDMGRFRTERVYAQAVAEKLLEYVLDADRQTRRRRAALSALSVLTSPGPPSLHPSCGSVRDSA